MLMISPCAPLAIYGRAIQDVPLELAWILDRSVSRRAAARIWSLEWKTGISINEGIHNQTAGTVRIEHSFDCIFDPRYRDFVLSVRSSRTFIFTYTYFRDYFSPKVLYYCITNDALLYRYQDFYVNFSKILIIELLENHK